MLSGRMRHTPTARYVIFAALKPWTHLVLDSIPAEDTYITNTVYCVVPPYVPVLSPAKGGHCARQALATGSMH